MKYQFVFILLKIHLILVRSIKSQLGNIVVLVRLFNFLDLLLARQLIAVLHEVVKLVLQLHDFIELLLIKDKHLFIQDFDYFLLLVN